MLGLCCAAFAVVEVHGILNALLEVQERGVWIPWRLQSSNRAGYLVGGLKPGPGLHPPLALGEEREPPGLDVLSLALSQRR